MEVRGRQAQRVESILQRIQAGEEASQVLAPTPSVAVASQCHGWSSVQSVFGIVCRLFTVVSFKVCRKDSSKTVFNKLPFAVLALSGGGGGALWRTRGIAPGCLPGSG